MPTLYNHSLELTAAQYEAHDLEKYRDISDFGGLDSARAIAVTAPEDTIQLDARLRDSFPHIREHFAEVGLEITDDVIWDTSAEIAKDFPGHDLSVYRFDAGFHEANPNERRLATTTMANDKNRFIEFCADGDHPIPPTHVFEGEGQPDFSAVGLPAFVKASRSAHGVSIYRVNTLAELVEFSGKAGADYQVQEEVQDCEAFLNVQYRADSTGRVSHLATTEQILDGFAHAGNRHPSAHDPQSTTDRLAKDLAGEGLEDVFAFDVAVGKQGMRIIECNARWNGATYPTLVANKLGIQQWEACEMPTSLKHPGEIDLKGLTYDAAKSCGAILINCSFMERRNRVNMLIAGDPEACAEQKRKLAERLATPATRKTVSFEGIAPFLAPRTA